MVENLWNGKKIINLKEISYIKSGTTPTVRDENLKEGVILLKTDNIRNNPLVFQDKNDFFFINEATNTKMGSTSLIKDDILINIVGTTTDVIGRCSLIVENFPKSNITQAMSLLRIKDNDFLAGYVFVCLMTKFGTRQVQRLARPTGQFNLNLKEVAAIEIPYASIPFQQKITDIILENQAITHRAEALYAEAEALLLDALGLRDWQPETYTYTIGNTAFMATKTQSIVTASDMMRYNRLDAEFWQPKYDAMMDIITKNAIEVKKIATLLYYNQRGSQPNYIENGTVKVINSRHIKDKYLDYANFETTDETNYKDEVKAHVFKNDILTYTTGANVGRTNVYLAEDEALASNHVNILRVKKDAVYIAFVMNSIIGLTQTERMTTGSAQAELYPKDIAAMQIPFINAATIAQIEDKLAGYEYRKSASRTLLHRAKRAVEMYIEEDEAAAMRYLASEGGGSAVL